MLNLLPSVAASSAPDR